MGRGRRVVTLLAGILIGICLAPAALAASEILNVVRSDHTFFVDGRQVDLEAYNINGRNYVQVRSLAEAVGFNAYWDGAVQIESDSPYTGTAAGRAVPCDYSAEANPAIFTGNLSPQIYNAIRDVIIHEDEVLTGSYTPVAIPYSEESKTALDTATSALGTAPVYGRISSGIGRQSVDVWYAPAFDAAMEHTKPFIESLAGLSDMEKIREIAWYVCDRLDYSVKPTSPSEILATDSVSSGSCMSYAHSVQFLCNLADIPCTLVISDNHQWNLAYLDSHWWELDVTGNDFGPNELQLRDKATLTYPFGELQNHGPSYEDANPEYTMLLMELLVPGSTK